MAQDNQMPDGTWPITNDDKVEIQALGRELEKFLQGYFKDREQVHLKIVVGGFNYIMDLQTQKTKLIGDDFLLADKSVRAAKLENRLEEPFQAIPAPVPPTIEERRAALQKQLEELDAEEEVAEASPAPTEGAEPMNTEGPSNTEPVPAADPAPVAEAVPAETENTAAPAA